MTDLQLAILLDSLTAELRIAIEEVAALMPEDAERTQAPNGGQGVFVALNPLYNLAWTLEERAQSLHGD